MKKKDFHSTRKKKKLKPRTSENIISTMVDKDYPTQDKKMNLNKFQGIKIMTIMFLDSI